MLTIEPEIGKFSVKRTKDSNSSKEIAVLNEFEVFLLHIRINKNNAKPRNTKRNFVGTKHY